MTGLPIKRTIELASMLTIVPLMPPKSIMEIAGAKDFNLQYIYVFVQGRNLVYVASFCFAALSG